MKCITTKNLKVLDVFKLKKSHKIFIPFGRLHGLIQDGSALYVGALGHLARDATLHQLITKIGEKCLRILKLNIGKKS